jgi:outer membrane scaffolding protein for murein synthesis (MipA/OmpV family)
MRLLLVFVTSIVLQAQEPMAVPEVPESQPGRWSVVLGARVLNYSAYAGSDRTRTVLAPVFGAEYDNRYYLGSSRVGVGFGGGVHLFRNKAFTFDLGLGVGDGRPESRAPQLAGMGDRKATLFAGVGLHWREGGTRAGFTLAHGLKDAAGNRGTLLLSQSWPLAQDWRISFGLHGAWADAQAMAYDFGVNPEQAAVRAALVASGDTRLGPSDLGTYTPSAGLRDFGTVLSLGFRPAPKWNWSLSVYSGQLQGDARNSPLVRRDAYVNLATGLTYRF